MISPIREFEAEIVEGVAERLALVPAEHLEPTLRGIASGFIGEVLERWPATPIEDVVDSAERFVRAVQERAEAITRASENLAGRA